jgi:TP901 family phage tail tape measure protein
METKLRATSEVSSLTSGLDKIERGWDDVEKSQQRVIKSLELLRTGLKNQVTGEASLRSNLKQSINTLENYNRILATSRIEREKLSKTNTANAIKSESKAFDDSNGAIKRTTENVKNLTLGWQSLGRIFAIQFIHQGVSALISKMQEGIETAQQFIKSISEIRTIQGEAAITSEQWGEALYNVSNSFGLELLDTAEAQYQTLSNQIGNAAESMLFMDEASKFAVVTSASLEDAVNLGTAALNSFGKSAGESNEVFASLFKTIELGRVRASEMANSFGRISVTADQLNIPMSDVSSLIELITVRGVKWSEAATQIRGVMQKLIAPTEYSKNLLREWGYDSFQSAIQARGFQAVLEKIYEKTGGVASEIAKVIPRIRGMQGAFIALAEGVKDFDNQLDKNKITQEEYEKRVKETTENAGKQYEIFKTRIKNAFTEIDDDILRYLNDITGGIAKWSDDTIAIIKATFVAGGVAIIGILGTITAGLLASNPIVAATAVTLGALVFALTKVGQTEKNQAAEAIKSFEDYIKSRQKYHAEQLKQLQEEKEAIKDTYAYYISIIEEANAAYYKSTKALISFAENHADAVKGVYDKLKSGIKDLMKEAEKSIKEAEKVIKSMDKEILSLSLFKDELKLKWSLEGKSPEEQFKLLTKELERLKTEQLTLANFGDAEEFDDVSKRIRELFEELLKLDIKKKNTQQDYLNQIDNESKLREEIKQDAQNIITDQQIIIQEHQADLDILEKSYEVIKKISKDGAKFLESLDGPELENFLNILEQSYLNFNDLSVKIMDGYVDAQAGFEEAAELVRENIYNYEIKLATDRFQEEIDNERDLADERISNAQKVHAEEMKNLKEQYEYRKHAILEFRKLDRQNTGLNILNNLIDAAPLGTTFASGGPIGTDTVNAWLTPDEFVVNQAASKKWRAQLHAMNSNRPAYFAEGGPVTNYNFGGVTMPITASGNTGMDIIAIGKGLNRAIRQGRLKLETR